MRKSKKLMVLAMAAGTLFQFGCLGGFFNAVVKNLPGNLLTEFLTDNTGIWDVFPDGGTTTTP